MHINGKTFVVTGAGSGIGRALTLQFLRKEASVAAVDLNSESLNETKSLAGEHENKLSLHFTDISNRKMVEALPEEILQYHTNIDGLINNAGIIQPFVKINDLTYEQIEKVMNVNFYGMLYMTKTFLPLLLKQPEAHIANISSMGGFLPVPGQSAYGASKAAVKLFTEGLYAELADTNVHVSVVFPGATATNITTNSKVEVPNMGEKAKKFKALSADEAAEIIIKGIEKDAYQIYVGKDSQMMNLLNRIAPKFANNLISNQMKSLLSK